MGSKVLEQTTSDLGDIMDAVALRVGDEEPDGDVIDDGTGGGAGDDGAADHAAGEDGGTVNDNDDLPGGASGGSSGDDTADGGAEGGEPDGGEPDGGEPDGGEPDGGEPDGGVKPKKPRFKSHEEAETGYTNLFSLHQQTVQKLKRFEDSERDEAAAKALQASEEKFRSDLKAFSKERNSQALKDIDGLDPEAEDYNDQVSAILADKDADIFDFGRRQRLGGTPAADDTADAGAAADDAAAGGTDGETEAQAEARRQRNWNYAFEQADKAGIDRQDPYFMDLCTHEELVSADGKPISLEELMERIIGKTKAYHDGQAALRKANEKKAAARAEQNSRQNGPLGASPASRREKPSKPVKKMSIGDMLNEVESERRL